MTSSTHLSAHSSRLSSAQAPGHSAGPSPLLSILIPAKDEVGNLPGLLDEIDRALFEIDHEVIVVDDASTDGTWEMLTRRATENPRLRPLRHERSAGQSTSVWQAAWAAHGVWLGTLDGDGQNDPADLPNLFARAQRGDVTLVAGHRTNRRDDWIKRVSSKVANRVRSALLNDATPDTGCGLKVVRRDAFLSLPYFDHMHRFLPALIRAQGGLCVSVAVNHRPRGTGESHYGLNNRLWVGLVDMVGVMWLRRRSRLPALIVASPSRAVTIDPSMDPARSTGNIQPSGFTQASELTPQELTPREPRPQESTP